MSDVENALAGATAAPEEAPVVQQEAPQEQAPESASEEEAQQEEQARDEKGRFVQKRINELTRRYHDEARARQSLESELNQLREQFARSNQPMPPDPNDDPQGYIAHLAREEARALIDSERRAMAEQQEQARLASIAQSYATREESYKERFPDYDEAVESLVSVVGPNRALGEVLMLSEQGPAVAYYLGQHLDEAVSIDRLPPHLAGASVARLEAKVSQVKPKPVTSAPAPAPKLAGASVAPKGAHDGLSIEDWMRERNSQNR